MPRKAYIADVAKVTAQEIPGINSIAKGSEDGDLNICFVPSSGIPIEIGLLALGTSLKVLLFHITFNLQMLHVVNPSQMSANTPMETHT